MRPREQNSLRAPLPVGGADSPSIRTPGHYPSPPPTSNWTLLAFAGLRGRQLHDLPGPLSQAQGEEEEGTVSCLRLQKPESELLSVFQDGPQFTSGDPEKGRGSPKVTQKGDVMVVLSWDPRPRSKQGNLHQIILGLSSHFAVWPQARCLPSLSFSVLSETGIKSLPQRAVW